MVMACASGPADSRCVVCPPVRVLVWVRRYGGGDEQALPNEITFDAVATQEYLMMPDDLPDFGAVDPETIFSLPTEVPRSAIGEVWASVAGCRGLCRWCLLACSSLNRRFFACVRVRVSEWVEAPRHHGVGRERDRGHARRRGGPSCLR